MDILIREYQRLAASTDQTPGIPGAAAATGGREILIPLLGLAGEAGELLSEYKKFLRDGDAHKLFHERIGEELGDLLWYLSNVATKFGLDLGAIAERNLSKCQDRWGEVGGVTGTRAPFDREYPEYERFPRRMEVELRTLEENGRTRMQAFMNGERLGNDLTDNAYENDGYRYHDIFHLACASVLAWSPVLRKLLGLKRKSRPTVDEVEDGGRAAAVEEGISAMVFSYAEENNFLEGVKGVDYDVLRTIKSMTHGFEVARCSAGEWERTIIVCFEVWRGLRRSGGGLVVADLDRGTLALGEAPMARGC